MLSYNKGRGYRPAQIIIAQHLTGGTLSGIWSQADCERVDRWQADHGLDDDGKVGPATWGAMLSEWTSRREMVPVDMWHDMLAKETLTKLGPICDGLVECGVSRLIVELDGSEPDEDGGPVWGWTHDQLAMLADALAEVGVEMGVMVWARPTRQYIFALRPALSRLLDGVECALLELDLEGQWRKRHLEQKKWDMARAAEELLDELRWLRLPLGVTTYPYHAECSSSALVSPRVRELAPQAYSRRAKHTVDGERVLDPDFFHGAALGPGRFQSMAAMRAQGASTHGIPILTMGLAAWAQSGITPGGDPGDAMEAALAGALACDAQRVRYWSTKHLWSSKHAKAYPRDFLSRVRAGDVFK
jgi:hypothetical protein